jgi:AAA domain
MQEKAIDAALNTPDIALIQGPPGTGKTTVIAAILERLNELTDKRGLNGRGRVLLTGFQHDAVENMIERITLNSIPVPKFGKRSGQEDGIDTFERNLEEWCGRLASEMRERNPQIIEIEQEVRIRNLCWQYAQAPTRSLGADLASHIAALGVRILGEDVARWANALAQDLSRQEQINEQSAALLNAVRLLRVRPEAFADDGPERATDALDVLKEFLEEDEATLFNRASLWCTDDNASPFLNELAALKKQLLIRFTAPPVFRVEKRNDDVFALVTVAIGRIQAVGRSALDKKSAALAEFLAELESNPLGMIKAVSDYSFAFAATCQQSVGKPMQAQKGIARASADELLEYDYVIVDEAARVSPRDLLIPLAQGRRIILVGDHRQLPHIIDETIAEQMEEGETGQEESSWLTKSMFQYLFSERLKKLEENDGISRRVTLDTQYRMHPLLGDFISRNFYERFDASEKFRSGRLASDFAHDLPDTDGKPAVWLDIPAVQGTHSRSGTSWTRPAEATAIVRQLQAWITSEAGKDLSYGVISFYKAQAELIRRQLSAITGDEKRLRVGTVDAFQGMEFDVVFLSVVRTCPQGKRASDDNREKQARNLFGHLCLYNRLNVSMSRQIKLLVVAGDSALLKNDLAAEYVPGLVDFLALCAAEGRILQ